MATSAARLEANRKNALKSTGPRTPEGKAICRGNALKHGLTGACVVVPDEDVNAVSGLFTDLEAEMRPKRVMSLILVRRIALLTIRLDRSARQEAARIGEAMRNAAAAFIDARLAEVERLISWIAAEPATNARRLRSTPEGTERLIRGWLDLDAELAKLDASRWSYSHWELIENLQGRRTSEFPISREGSLFKTILGEPGYLDASEVGAMDMAERRDYAAARLRERVAGHVADLRALLETFDPVAEARSRDEAGKRALFDTSKEAILARKYEAATERAMYRAFQELREVEAAPERPESADATPDPGWNNEAMGLNLPGASEPPGDEAQGSWRSPSDRRARARKLEKAKQSVKSGRRKPA